MIFDFHHHHKSFIYRGIYNRGVGEFFSSSPYSIGLHPHDIKQNWKKQMKQVYEISKQNTCIALGECGLDALAPTSNGEQIKVFEAHITQAEALKKPIIIHCVRRHHEVMNICKDLCIPKIIHGFNKKDRIAELLLSHGFYLSFGASLMNSISLQTIFKNLPEESFVLETDTAHLDIQILYEKAAQLRGVSVGDLEYMIDNNLKNIFGW
ncbi:deoxyribonuclease [Elizabethkingia argentiflava]|uniref:Deoxyribonuclease n=1 Tax=Elizabethkingia argenteiflava TaxID=2681556 RepID=A0A845Q1I2_9FLAO|nr:TatD family hydrolase [Elizabethkingia argenteiflava]NAW52190.1 deoxyribonuclease [Elizabethkingia argenteiflava]